MVCFRNSDNGVGLIIVLRYKKISSKSKYNQEKFPNDDKKKTVEECFQNFSSEVKNFLFILIDEKRINCLDEIKAFLKDKINDKNNLVNANITLAFDVNDEIKNQIIQRLKNKLQKDVNANFVVNPNIIGGLKIQVKDTVIDLSINKRLENFNKI